MKALQNVSLRWFALAAATGAIALGVAGCNGCNSTPAPIVSSQTGDNGQDPATANMSDDSYNAPAGSSQPTTAVMGQTETAPQTQSGENYPADSSYNNTQGSYDQGYDQGQAAQEAADTTQAPPPLPEYDQPPAPDPNDLWTPGYWAWGTGGYYWVPGAWVAAPYYGALWTPPYWGYYGNHYYFHHGYWGPHIGFYGGVNYGFGYIGTGFFGGYWSGNHFFYNRAVTRIPGGWGNNYVYNRDVVYNNVHYGMQPTVRVSFNGGPGGINRAPSNFERAAMHEQHEGPLAVQTQNHMAAAQNRAQFFNQNHGRPAEVAANHAFGNAGAIRPTPEGIHPGRPGMNGMPARGAEPAGVRPGEAGRPGEPNAMNRPGMPGGQGGVRPGQPATPMNRPGMPGGQGGVRPGEPATPMNRPGMPGGQGGVRPGEPATPMNRPGMPGGQGGARPTPEVNHAAPAMNHPAPAAPQMHQAPMQQHAAPEQHAAPAMHAAPEQHAAPQMHAAPEQHAAPAQHAAPEQHVAPAPHPAPAPHAAPAPAPHAAPAGGGGHPEGGHH